MDGQDVHDVYDMMKGNMTRMFLTDDVKELVYMHEIAKERLERIYEYHYARLNDK